LAAAAVEVRFSVDIYQLLHTCNLLVVGISL
jgi:hypothetical protein